MKCFKIWILKKFKSNRHHTKRINKSQLDGGECFQTSVDAEEEDVEEMSENKLTLGNLAEVFQLFETAFNSFTTWTLLYDSHTETKANGERKIGTIQKRF